MSADSNRGIVAVGVSVPRFRLDTNESTAAWDADHAGGVEHKAVPAADEDAVTMAVAAAEDALDHGDIARDSLAFVGLATMPPLLAESELAPRAVRSLALPRTARTVTETASPLAGLDVLDRALTQTGRRSPSPRTRPRATRRTPTTAWVRRPSRSSSPMARP